MADKKFVTRLNVAKCSFGSIDDQYLNIPKDHGVYYQDTDHPLLNANDHIADKHIIQFGRCTSKANPENAASSVLSSVIPILGLLSTLKKAMGCDGCKCSPKTLTVWMNGDKKNKLDGVEAINDKSKAICFYGGIITIEEKKDDASTSLDEGSDDTSANKPKTPKDKMPESVAASIDEKNKVPMQNYMNNMNTPIPPNAVNSQGSITNQAAMSGFACGNSTLSACGAASIATYNAFNAMGEKQPLEDVIIANELKGTHESPLQECCNGIQSIFEATKHKTRVLSNFSDIAKDEVLMIGRVVSGATIFNTFKPLDDGGLMCVEDENIDVDSFSGDEQIGLAVKKNKGLGTSNMGLSLSELPEKVRGQVYVDNAAIYGYSPMPGTCYEGLKFYDEERTKNNRQIRLDYLDDSVIIQSKIEEMRNSGCKPDEIATTVVDMRNESKVRARELMAPDEVKALEERNMEKYSNPIGPSAQDLFSKKLEDNSRKKVVMSDDDIWESITKSSTRKDPFINSLLGIKH